MAGLLPVHRTVGNVLCFKCGIPMPPNVLQDHICKSRSRVPATSDQRVTSVQLRQHVPHPRTFFYLEQLIVKRGAAAKAIMIKQMDQGVDFFFSNKSHAENFVEFIREVCPIKFRIDEQLVSHDSESNTHNYMHVFSVEICPICREDLIYLPPEVGASLDDLGPLVICTKVTNSVALVDPLTLRHCFLDADRFWRSPFRSLLTSRQLVEYIILNIKKISSEINVGGSMYVLAVAQVAPVSDFEKNGTIFMIRTHLGHILNPGDYALGYDLYGAHINDIELDNHVLSEAILIKKIDEENLGKPQSSDYVALEELLADLASNEVDG